MNISIIKLGTFFESNLGKMAAKVLKSLGIGVLVFAALTNAFNIAVSETKGAYMSIPADTLQLANLAGIGDALGIIVGAMAFKVSFAAGSKIGVLPK